MTCRASVVFALLLLAAGCSGEDDDDSVPANPTWDEHVQAILAASCTACHADTPLSSAPDGFRLDSYADDGDDLGAASFRCDIRNRAVEGTPSYMPPAGPIASAQRETIARWIEQGAPEFEGGPTLTPCP